MSDMMLLGEINKLWRRLIYVIGRGLINVVADGGPVQIVQISLSQNEVRDNTARVAEYGFFSNPPPGTNCIAVFLSGDRSNGVIIGTNNQTYRMRNTAPGESGIHDAQGKYVYLKNGVLIIEAAGQPVEVNNATSVTINASDEVIMNTPLLKVSGDIIDNFASQTDTMKGMREKYNIHTHGGVQSGASSTSAPNILE